MTVALYPNGSTTFTDVDDADNARSFSLWDSLDPINAVAALHNDQRCDQFHAAAAADQSPLQPAGRAGAVARTGSVWSPRTSVPRHCTNEIAVWRISNDGLRKELSWSPGSELDRRRRRSGRMPTH